MRRLTALTLAGMALVALLPAGARAQTVETPEDRVAEICRQAIDLEGQMRRAGSREIADPEVRLEHEAYLGRLRMILERERVSPGDREAYDLLCGIYLRGANHGLGVLQTMMASRR